MIHIDGSLFHYAISPPSYSILTLNKIEIKNENKIERKIKYSPVFTTLTHLGIKPNTFTRE